MPGTLWVMATPIGNLADFSDRARQIWPKLAALAVESTTSTKRLANALGLTLPRLWLCREDSPHPLPPEMRDLLLGGQDCALLSDAGTPAISDPGWKLCKACHELHIPVLTLPGPSSLSCALSVAGLPTRRFRFEGFPPNKRRAEFFARLSQSPDTCVFFDTPHDVHDTLKVLAQLCHPQRRLAICRELTKLHEQTQLRSLEEWSQSPPMAKGEFVLILEGAPPPEHADSDKNWSEQATYLADCGLSSQQIRDFLTKFTDCRRNQAYQLALQATSSREEVD